MADYTLYGVGLSIPAVKVGTALNMTGQAFAYKHVDMRGGEGKTPEYQAISRWGQVPALVHGDVKLVQSNVILEYLGETTGKLWPTDRVERYRAKEWFAWEPDLLLPGIALPRGLKRFYGGEPAAVIDFMRKRGERALGMLNDHLDKNEWLVGKAPSLADVAVAVDCTYIDEAEIRLDAFPAVKTWADKIARLPGWKNPKELLPMPAA
jgi:glutathione S-transferase